MTEDHLFYRKIVCEIIKDRNASILVCGGSFGDKEIFRSLGFLNVIISGMDDREYDYSPFKWQKENAEFLSFSDESFDYVVMHAAIHHTQLPHKVLTEMYRVSKRGFLAFEGRDSLLIRIAEKFGFTQEYEVAGNYSGLGANGTDIPNHIYRWTEREIEKTIKSYAPSFKHMFIYKYGTLYPHGPDLSLFRKSIIWLLRPFYYVFVRLFPRQQNLFAFFVEKPNTKSSLLPWLFFNDDQKKIEVNYNWITQNYTSLKKRRT